MNLALEPDVPKRQELARFLKAMRDRANPADLGLSVSPRRRAAGLLREEVAQAAGISLTWYTWMEQARPTNPSRAVLDGLAKALHLDAAERAHLFRIARSDLMPLASSPARHALNETQTTLLHGLAPHPAYAFDARWDVVAWNRPAAVLLGDFDPDDPMKRNILFRLFLDPEWRHLFADWNTLVRSSVEQFRAMTTHLIADPDFQTLVEAIERTSPKFSSLWKEQRVRHPPTWRKTLDHPGAGRLCFVYSTLRPDDVADDLRFAVYVPADQHTERRFTALLARTE